jgi:anti-repressor protein
MGYTGDKASAFKEKFINEFNKRELMLKDDDYIMNRALEISSKRMKSLEQQLLAKNEILAIQETVIKESAPKIEYYDKVLQSKGLIPINIIANELGMTAQKLNKLLKEQKIQYKVKETWVLHAEYRDKGYTKHETFPYTDEDGNNYTSQHMYWYEKGREFIHKVINDLRKVA